MSRRHNRGVPGAHHGLQLIRASKGDVLKMRMQAWAGMKSEFRTAVRGIARAVLVGIALFSLPAAAMAQSDPAPDPPPVISPLHGEPDVNAVNLLSGNKNVDMPVILSTPADPRLTFDKVQNSAPYISGMATGLGLGGDIELLNFSYSTHVGGDTSESFKCSDADCQSVTWSGSILNVPPHNYQRAPGGEVYHFTLLSLDQISGNMRTLRYYASTVTYPDGEVISYTYDTGQAAGDPSTYYRPTQISSNTGYYITVSYQYTGTDPSQPGWGTPAQAALYAPGGTLIRRFVYSGNTITDYGNSVSNTGGRTFTGGPGNALGTLVETDAASIQLPNETSTELTVNQSTNGFQLIGSIVRDGVQWNYAYTNPQWAQDSSTTTVLIYDSLNVTGPNGYNVTYAMEPASYWGGSTSHALRNIVQSRTDALGHVTNYAYDVTLGDRLTGITLPEGNAVSLTYDNCGNVIQKTTTEKPSAGTATITESATYATQETGIPEQDCPNVNAYLPLTHTDALNRVTNFTYNSDGQLTQQLDPADASNVRRETDITYTANTNGISLKTLARVCGQTTTCSGNAQSHTEYTYWNNTGLPLTVTQKDEATSTTRVTTYGYDVDGRVAKIDGPLSGTDDAKYFQYDTYGRKTWEVGERGPNGLRIAKNYIYRDSDDKVTSVQTGTVNCASACDTASLTLTLLQQTDTTYDSRRYAVRETTYKGSTTDAVSDASFLDLGLAECATVRMNFASLPATSDHGACTLGTQGSQGPDRITLNSYDAAGELTLIQKAYGVTTANGFPTTLQTNYAAYTYTPNGKQLTVTDADSNEAQYVYDGFDRLYEWQFPSTTIKNAVDTSDYEQYTYDNAGNRTCFRKRDGSKLTFTYDGLNRTLSKVVAATSGGTCP